MIYLYDGTFDGFLSVVFNCYATRRQPAQIVRWRLWQSSIFDTPVRIDTNMEHAQRVWSGIIARANQRIANMLYYAFASELPGVDMELYHYLQKMFADKSGTFHQNLLDETGHNVYRIARKVTHEAHRFTGFVRFQQTADGLFFAAITPDHDIVSLLAHHFAKRYADQHWVIYDTGRNKGVYSDGQSVSEIILTDKQFNTITGELTEAAKHTNEDFYKTLWKKYYKAIGIPERKNTRLMLRCMPRRYWKYMPEKS